MKVVLCNRKHVLVKKMVSSNKITWWHSPDKKIKYTRHSITVT